MIRFFTRRRALLAQLDCCQVRYLTLAGDHHRERTLNNDLLAELQEITEERDALAAESRQRGCDAAKWAGLYQQAIAQRDQARAIAVDLENENAELRADIKERIALAQKSMALRDQSFDRAAGAYNTRIRELTDQRDQALAQAETARAAAEAADIPIVDGLNPDDYVAMRRAVFDAVAPRKPSDNRRRIYIDGHGLAWIDSCQDPDGTQYIDGIDASPGREEAAEKVRARTGGLRVIGATK